MLYKQIIEDEHLRLIYLNNWPAFHGVLNFVYKLSWTPVADDAY